VKNFIFFSVVYDFIKLEQTHDESFKAEFDIKQEPALIIEEESIDFRDMIFE